MQRNGCLRILSTCCMVLCGLAVSGRLVRAEEPVGDFLDQLHENQYYELALAYLDRIEKGEIPASDAVKSDVLLDRGLTLRMAAVASRSAKERDQHFDASEAALRKFLETQPNSTRIEEARLQLATLLLVRGARLAETPKADDATKKRAQELLTGAAKAYDEIVDKLREKLKAMQGQKIEGDEQINLRNTYRSQYLAAMLSGGTARQRLASLLAKESPERKKFLDEAIQKFTELTDKHSDRPQGALAQYYRGQVNEELGKPDAALDSYLRMVELDVSDIEELRDARVNATAQAIAIWLKKDPPVYKPAIEKGSLVLDGMTAMDRISPQWQALGLQTAKAYLVQAAVQEKEKAGSTKINASKKEARRLLMAAVKVPGDHQAEATKLLGDLGVDTDTAAPTQVAQVKTFAEAVGRARELMEETENQATPLKLVEDKLAATPNDETLQKQRAALLDEMSVKRSEAITLLQRAPRMATEETTIDDLNQARFYLAYLLWREDRFRETLVVANFLCRKYPSSALAPQAGVLAVTAYQGLISQAPDKVTPSVVKGLEELSLYLVERWPNEPAAQTASEILVRVALNQGRWKDAEGYLVKIPDNAPQRATLQQLIGQLQWNEYLKLNEEKKKPEADQALDRVIASFTKGLKDVKPENVDTTALTSALLLAKAHLRKDKPAAAIAVLDHQATGPLKRVEGDKAVADLDPGLIIDTYRTGLQVLVTLSTDGSSDGKQLDRAATLIDKLREAVKTQPDPEKRLIAIYYGLAKDTRAELDQATPDRRGKLVAAFRLLLEKLAQTTDDTNTLLWIGQTFSEIAQSLIPANATGPATGQPKELLASAIDAYNKALQNAPEDAQHSIRFSLAKAARLSGEYKLAIDELEKVLTAKPTMIDAQIEGAQAFQDWAAVGSEKLYEVAMTGGRKNAKGQPTIWGWGKISVVTNGKPQFQATFYEARYKLAECRYLFAKRQKNPEETKRYAQQAIKDINTVLLIFPTMGGPESRARFDQLMKNVQTLIGEQPVGLGAPPAENAASAANPASDGTR